MGDVAAGLAARKSTLEPPKSECPGRRVGVGLNIAVLGGMVASKEDVIQKIKNGSIFRLAYIHSVTGATVVHFLKTRQRGR